MKNFKIRLSAIFLILPLLLVSVTSCGQIDFGLSDHTTNGNDTNNTDTNISGSGNANSQNPSNIVATGWYEYETDIETFVYGLVANELSVYYDVYSAVITLSSGEEVYGIGFTDYSEAFEFEDGSKTLFSSGFVSFCGELSIPQEEYESGIEIERLDNDDEEYGFVYAFSREPFASHCVVFGEYVTFGVTEESEIYFTEQTCDKEYLRENFDESLGTLYSYDEERVLNELNVGEYVPLGGVSVLDEIDFTALEGEINRIIEEQNYNFSTVDVQTAVYIAQDALNSYLLSLQEETFMGYRVADLVELSKQIDPMECIRITPDGFELVDIQPTPPPTPSGLMKWMTGIVAGIAVVGGIVLAVYGMPHLGGAVIGASVEVFTEVVIENKTLENVDWRKVAIASVAGAISANLGLFGDSVVGGATNATFTLIDGGSWGDAANSFAIGTAAGLVLGGAFKLAGNGVQKISNKISAPPKVVKVSVVNDTLNLDGKIANKIDDSVVDAATYQTKRAINIQLFAGKADDASNLTVKPNANGVLVEGNLTVSTGNYKKTTVQIKRKVYQYDQNIDFNYLRSDGMTNYQAMLKGNAPVVLMQGSDGIIEAKLELHHFTQQETINFPGSEYLQGSLIEIPASTHDKYTKILHVQYPHEDGIRRSFRVTKTYDHTFVRSQDDRQFIAFKAEYWKLRALSYMRSK